MTKIEEYLATWPDQRLANLQCAAEDGKLRYYDTCGCLLHHRYGNYSVTKWMGPENELARAAEREFYDLAFPTGDHRRSIEEDDITRRKALLPLIHAEWQRRGKPVPVTFEQPATVLVANDR